MCNLLSVPRVYAVYRVAVQSVGSRVPSLRHFGATPTSTEVAAWTVDQVAQHARTLKLDDADVNTLKQCKVAGRVLFYWDELVLSLSAIAALLPYVETLRHGEPKTILINQAGFDLVEQTFSTQAELKEYLSDTGSTGMRCGDYKVVRQLKELKAGHTYTVEFARCGFVRPTD